MKILVYGYGNPGRQDDALGNEFVRLINRWSENQEISNIATDSNYQLNIEEADTIAQYDKVFFVDASKEEIESFIITRLEPDEKASFSTHAAHPAYILFLCNKLYHKSPETYLIHIKGYEWTFLEEMSTKAIRNLQKAFQFFINAFYKNFNEL